MRRRGLVVLLLALALGGLYLLLLHPEGTDQVQIAPEQRGGSTAEGPTLLGSGGSGRTDRASMGSLVVWVTRDGRPVPAGVTLIDRRRVGGPILDWGMQWSDRHVVPGGERTQIIGQATAGADGQVTFQPPRPGLYAAIARTHDGARGRATGCVASDGSATPVFVAVSGGGTLGLVGRVRTFDHAPWRGFVDVSSNLPDGVPADMLEPHPTDETGRFQVTGLRPGAAWIVLWTSGAQRWETRRLWLPHEGELILTLPPQPPEVACRVLDARTGVPIAGALVSRTFLRTGEFTLVRAEAVSDVHGSCRLMGWPTDVEASGYEPLTLDETEGTGEAVLRLQALRGIHGRVVERGSRAPAIGAIVLGRRAIDDGSGAAAVAVADAEGRFRLEGVPHGPAWVWVAGGGWCSPVRLGVGEDDAFEIECEAVRSARVQGRVLDASGAPVRGALVWLGSLSWTSSVPAADVLSAVDGTWPATHSGADGTYALELRNLHEDTTLSALAAPHAPVRIDGVRGGSGEVITRDLVLPVGRRLVVHVAEARTGAPAGGVSVSARCDASGAQPAWGQARITDASGVARFEGLPPSGPRVTAGGRGWAQDEVQVPMQAEAKEDLEVRVELRRAVSLLSGTVRFEDGSPLTDVYIDAEGEGGWITSTIDTDGRFEVEGTAAPEVTLVFRDGDAFTPIHSQVAQTGSTSLDIVLPTPTRRAVTLRVRDAAGQPVGRFTAWGIDDRDSSQVFRATSELRVPAFEGRMWFLVRDVEGPEGEALDAAPTAFGPYDSDGKAHDVRLLPGRSVSGRVVDADGRPLPGIQVTAKSLIVPQPAELLQGAWDPWASKTLADRLGRFVVRGLGEGPAVLRAEGPPGMGDGVLQVEAGATGVVLVVPRLTTVDVRVTDESGAPVEGAALVFLHPERIEVTSAEGVARLSDVDLTEARWLEVRPPPGRPELRGTDRMLWRPSTAPFVLQRSLRIAGRVVDERGAPVLASIYAEYDGLGSSTDADEQGRWEITSLRRGRIAVWARTEEPARTSSRVTVEADATDLRLVVARGSTLAVRVVGARGAVARAEVHLTSKDGAPASSDEWTDEHGVARFGGLRARDRYDLLVHHEGEDEATLLAFTGDVPGDAGEVTLTLVAPLTLSGFVQGPPPGTTIFVSVRARGLDQEGYARTDGGFLLTDIPAGTWTVRAESIGAERRWVGTATAAAGSRITLTLAPE